MGARRSSNAPESERGKRRRKSGVRASTPGAACRRRHNRYPVSLAVRVAREGAEPVQGTCENLGLGGMRVALPHAYRPGDRLRLWLELPDTVLFMTGSVIWIDDAGVGIEQHILGARDTFVLTQFLADVSALEG